MNRDRDELARELTRAAYGDEATVGNYELASGPLQVAIDRIIEMGHHRKPRNIEKDGWNDGFMAGVEAAQSMTGFTDETFESILAKEGLIES